MRHKMLVRPDRVIGESGSATTHPLMPGVVPLLARNLEPVVGEDEVLLVLGLVTAEAAVEIGGGVGRLVGAENLIFPLAVARRLGVLAAPPGALCHDPVTADVARLDKSPVGVLDWISLRIESQITLGDGIGTGRGLVDPGIQRAIAELAR